VIVAHKYRQNAAECIRAAQRTEWHNGRAFFITLTQNWLTLAKWAEANPSDPDRGEGRATSAGASGRGNLLI
jgi:hypothetical protein